MAGVTGQKEQNSPLLKLPAELRNRIYEYALFSNKRIHISRRSESHTSPMKSRSALLSTCRQIRSEASAIFYARNTFVIHGINGCGDAAVTDWLSTIEEDTRPVLRKVYIHGQVYSTDGAFDRIKRCHACVTASGIAIKNTVLFVEVDRDEEDVDIKRAWMNLRLLQAEDVDCWITPGWW